MPTGSVAGSMGARGTTETVAGGSVAMEVPFVDDNAEVAFALTASLVGAASLDEVWLRHCPSRSFSTAAGQVSPHGYRKLWTSPRRFRRVREEQVGRRGPHRSTTTFCSPRWSARRRRLPLQSVPRRPIDVSAWSAARMQTSQTRPSRDRRLHIGRRHHPGPPIYFGKPRPGRDRSLPSHTLHPSLSSRPVGSSRIGTRHRRSPLPVEEGRDVPSQFGKKGSRPWT